MAQDPFRKTTRMKRGTKKEKAEKATLAAAYPPRDDVDREIERAVSTGTPVDLSRAFPEIDPVVNQIPKNRPTAPARAGYTGGRTGMKPVPATPERQKHTIAEPDVEEIDQDTGPIPELPAATDMPSDRANQIAKTDKLYLEEYRMKVLARMLLRDLPLDMIAQAMKLSVPTVRNYRTKLFSRLRDEASKFDTTSYIGESMAFYREIEALSLRLGVDQNTQTHHKLEAFRTALTARQHKSQMLHAFGVVDRIPFDPANQGKAFDGGNEDAMKLIDMVKAVMEGDEAIDGVYQVIDEDEDAIDNADVRLT